MAKISLVVAGMAVAALACVLQMIGVATPFWQWEGSYYSGLWKACGPRGFFGPTECADISHPEGWRMAVSAFGILAVLAQAGSAVSGLLLVKGIAQLNLMVPPALACAGGLCSLISFATYAGQTVSSHFAFSFFVCIVAAVLSGVSATCFFLGKHQFLAAVNPVPVA